MNSCNILIVEDEFLNAQFLEQVVEGLGHRVVGNVQSANEALMVAREHIVDVVLMDINIEGDIDGIQCSILLNHKKNIPTIYITAFGDSATIGEATNTNIYGYIIKPFNENDIEAVLAVAVSRLKREKNKSSDEPEEPKYTIELGEGYCYNLKSKTLLFSQDQEQISLSKTLSNLLYLLCLHFDHIVTHEKLVNFVWNDKSVSDSTVRDTVLRLRKTIPMLNIETISGVGYCLKSQKDE
ncbi:MAG: response regulator [Campylobacterales bacterium]|nr:response regulator [Campylobacterales bacterium]